MGEAVCVSQCLACMQSGDITVAESPKVADADAAGTQVSQEHIRSRSASVQLARKGECLSQRRCPRSLSMDSLSPGCWTEVSFPLPSRMPPHAPWLPDMWLLPAQHSSTS